MKTISNGCVLFSGLLAFSRFLFHPNPVAACSPDTTNIVTVPPFGMTIPANVGAIVSDTPNRSIQLPQPWDAAVDHRDAPMFRRTDTPGAIPFPAYWRTFGTFEPAIPFEPNATYEVVNGVPGHTFRTGTASPFPTTLGTATTGSPLSTSLFFDNLGAGGCDTFQGVFIPLQITLDPAAMVWKNAFLYRTVVDGVVFVPRHRLLTNRPFYIENAYLFPLTATCSISDIAGYVSTGVGQGTHRVKLTATLPGTDVTFSTPEISVEVRCLNGFNDPAGGNPVGMDATTRPGVKPAGCACRSAGQVASGSWQLFALLGVAFSLRRRVDLA